MENKDLNEDLWQALIAVYGHTLYSAKVSVILKEPNGINVAMMINFPPKEEFFE